MVTVIRINLKDGYNMNDKSISVRGKVSVFDINKIIVSKVNNELKKVYIKLVNV